MWWIVFTAVDLYIGLVILDALVPSLPAEEIPRIKLAKRVIVALLVLSAIALVVVLIKRWSVQA
jgi:hypothetical protein